MTVSLHSLWPELLLTAIACVLFLMGASKSAAVRRFVPILATAGLLAVVIGLCCFDDPTAKEPQWGVLVGQLATYIKLLSAAVAILFVFLAWPTNAEITGNAALDVGHEVGEFFALMLLAIAGIFLVASADDIILLFLGIELASIPTYIMVSISRPLPVAQEAGVKYFFLGAMAAALMLFGFSYLYGTTGSTSLIEIRSKFHPGLGSEESVWQLFAVVMLMLGFTFKLAAVPLHTYAGDVYQGAATPVTALLAYVPKASGIVAVIKVLAVVAGPNWDAPVVIVKLLFVIAVLTMTFGNVLGLMQSNIKRVFAYSSVAHSGYMLVGLTALLAAHGLKGAADVQYQAIGAVLFYIAAYGIMNTGSFGVLMLLPGRTDTHGRHDSEGNPLPTAGTAETFDDIAGQGRKHLGLGVAMAICCWSLTGLPLTVGFFGKFYLIKPAFMAGAARPEISTRMMWLVILIVINAAISAAYYLRIIAAMFLRPEPARAAIRAATSPEETTDSVGRIGRPWPVMIGVGLAVLGTLAFGVDFPAVNHLANRAQTAQIEPASTSPTPGPVVASTR